MASGNETETKGKVEKDIDSLFVLSLTEFTGARNALAVELKRSGHGDEAARVKALVKPSISAWAVNQLYWKQRPAFDRLIAAGQRFRQAQASQLAGNASDVHAALDARRESLANLSRLAAALLRDAGHNPTSDIMRRISGTLEAMSAYASLPDSPPPGRLTADLDPPGFDALAALIPAGTTVRTKAHGSVSDTRQLEQTRQEKIAAAKASLDNAERVLRDARTKWEEADRRARTAAAEAKEAAKSVDSAERAVESASKEVRSLVSKSPG